VSALLDTDKRPPRRFTLVLAALLLLTFGLRVWALDARPLWWDEGITLSFSRLSPTESAAFAAENIELNPPIYRWAVGGLTTLTGVSLFTSRLVGVYASTVAAAALFVLARRAFGRQAAAWTLLLFAFAPLQVYHAQEAKTYAFEAAAVLVGAILWMRIHRWALRKEPQRVTIAPWPIWAGYALTIPLAMGANYLAVFALLVENAYSLVLTIRASRAGIGKRALLGHWARFLAVQAAGAIVIVPFVLVTLNSSAIGLEGASRQLAQYSPLPYLWRFLSTFVAGEIPAGALGIGATVILLLLAIVGVLASGGSGRWFALSWLALPLALGYFFHLRFPWFFPRFLLYAQPALLALAGAGLAALTLFAARRLPPRSRAWPLTAGVLLAALFTPLLLASYAAPPRYEEDAAWPEMFEAIQPFVREDDLMIARMPWQPGYMYAYLEKESWPDWVMGYFDVSDIDEELGPLLGSYDRLWQIDYGVNPFRPPVDSIRWMLGKAALAYTGQFGPATASLLIDDEFLRSQEMPAEVADFENDVHLRWNPVTYTISPGDAVGVSLSWWTEAPLDTRLVRYLHLVSPDGRLLAQVDREPAMGYSMTYDWAPGEEIADPVALLAPLDLMPGEYELRVGLYDRDTLERVLLSGGADNVVVGHVKIR
jgi:hypothetical protein